MAAIGAQKNAAAGYPKEVGAPEAGIHRNCDLLTPQTEHLKCLVLEVRAYPPRLILIIARPIPKSSPRQMLDYEIFGGHAARLGKLVRTVRAAGG